MISSAEKAASLFWRTSVFALSSQVSASPIWALKSVIFLFSSILRALPDSRIQYIVKQVCHQVACNDQNGSKNNRAL